jgi:hypothetical protein
MILRYALATLAFITLGGTAFAQDLVKDGTKEEKKSVSKPARDFLMLQLMYEGWMNAPDSIKTTGLGRSVNGYICYDFPIKNSNFSFAAGIGIGTGNIYLKDQQVVLNDNDTNQQARFTAETTPYKKYKVNTTYLEAPFEMRFFGNRENRNKGFKAALGMRVGTLMGAHTKGREDGTKIVYKVNTKRFLETWRFAGTVRLGYGNFTLMGTYNFTNLYKENQGPPLTPFSLGLCITGL